MAASSALGSNIVSVERVHVGRRYRTDLGDIANLAASIEEIGLLHPIVVTPDHKLIAGERRLEAVKLLGWPAIPATTITLDDIAKGEFAENTHRKDFRPSESAAIFRALKAKEAGAARERQGVRTDQLPGKLPESSKGDARDKAAEFLARSPRTLEKTLAIVEAAEAEPERFAGLVADMDRTGRVDGPYRRLQIALQSDAIRQEPPPLPNRGPYRVIVADPPWPYEKRDNDPSHRGVLPYPTMAVVDICGLSVADITHDDAILWLWTTNHHMAEALQVLAAWDFKQKTILTWAKDRFGLGDWLRGQSEHCLVAVRGRPTVTLTNQTTLLQAPVRRHSQKPDEFYALVESLCPAPRYAELFQRTQREGWDGHGDEVGS